MTDKEKEFWEIFSDLQVLCRLNDEQVQDKEVNKHLRLMSNMIYFYRRDGAAKVKDAARTRALKELGIAVLKPKGKS